MGRREYRPPLLAVRLREIREDAGVSQVQLAALMCTGVSKIGRLERGQQLATVEDAQLWAAALGCRFEWALVGRFP